MSVITADFETYYANDYTLSKLSVEEYVRDKRFETLMVGLSINGGPAKVHVGEDAIQAALDAINWTTCSVLCHNTAFDGAILGWHYGVYPKFYLDTIGMARARGRTYAGGSLDALAKLEGIGHKGGFVAEARGKRLGDFTPMELHKYALYCAGDVELTNRLYRKYIPGFPLDALRMQDLMLRLFIEPRLRFDLNVLRQYETTLRDKRWQTLAEVATMLDMTWENQPLPTNRDAFQAFDILAENKITDSMGVLLRSDPKLASLLESIGVDPPTKLSPTTGLPTHAFAKTDEQFQALLDHDDPRVQTIVAARLGVKTSIEETRTKRFINIAERGPWPTMYNYYGAHTGRPTGGDKANPMNLKRGGVLRDAVLPPPGHLLVAADLSQIECRIVNYLAEQEDVIDAFAAYDARQGPDVYCIFAEKIYKRPITPENKTERTVGKVGELSLGYGAGKHSYRQMLFAQAGIRINSLEAQNVVDIYRTSHARVKKLWTAGENVLRSLVRGVPFTLGREGILDGSNPKEGIGLPNGMYIRYPLLEQRMNGKGETSYNYASRRGPVYIYGSMLIENVTQALANIVQQTAWLKIAERYRVVLNTYDELVIAVPEAEAEEAAQYMHDCLIAWLPWLPDMPIACTVGIGATYGTCK